MLLNTNTLKKSPPNPGKAICTKREYVTMFTFMDLTWISNPKSAFLRLC